ncbi:MAG: FKBP-type peptidyl-prolyl cis-trans isomerase [Bacteroidota bacterium]|nr:FKBP-type peptidyl-prolyl cis-trans isomerase [Bacteroidota bacterium]
MKTIFWLLPLCTSLSYGQTKKTTSKSISPKSTMALTSIDSLSYSIGVQVAEYYKTQGVEKVNPEFVKRAFNDVFNNKPLTISEEACNMNIQQKLQQFMSKKISGDKEAGIKFLKENEKRPGVITLPSGLQYEIITKGTGPVPKATDTVKANYIGMLIDGKEFDNSYKRGQPITIPVTGVIRGWIEALELMPVGSKWKLFIPSDMGYGDRGAGGVIPGGAALIFEMELLEIVKK